MKPPVKMKLEFLEERVAQFNALKLPGQPQAMHLGTSYLVNDLWQTLKILAMEKEEEK